MLADGRRSSFTSGTLKGSSTDLLASGPGGAAKASSLSLVSATFLPPLFQYPAPAGAAPASPSPTILPGTSGVNSEETLFAPSATKAGESLTVTLCRFGLGVNTGLMDTSVGRSATLAPASARNACPWRLWWWSWSCMASP